MSKLTPVTTWLLRNLVVHPELSITSTQIYSLLTAQSLLDENSSPANVRSAVSKCIKILTGNTAKRKRAGSDFINIYHGVGLLPDVNAHVSQVWFAESIKHVSALHRQYVCKDKLQQHVIEISSAHRGHKKIVVDHVQKHLISVEVRGSVVNLDKVPSISPTFESGQDLLETLNMISNMHLCESSKPSPSCPVLVHNSKNMCLRCQKNSYDRKAYEGKVNYKQGSDDMLQRIYAIGDEFGKFVEDQLRRHSMSKNATYAESSLNTLLRLYIRDRTAYLDLRQSGMIGPMPCPQTLASYKNRVAQITGINNEFLQWMSDEARALNVTSEGRIGGLVIDEMSIQPELTVRRSGDAHEFVGLTSLDTPLNTMNHGPAQLASSALQFIFNGYSGFSFPAAHYPVKGVTAEELLHLTNRLILALELHGFTVEYVSLDGAAANRKLVNINADFALKGKRYTCRNISNRSKSITWIMDPKHVVKKIRNSMEASKILEGAKRLIRTDKGIVVWDYFLRFYEWSNIESISISTKLTNEHLYPNDRLKMRNHLAEEVLNTDMLNNFKIYQQYLKDGSHLDAVIEMLEYTSQLIAIYNDKKVIRVKSDERLTALRDILAYFTKFKSLPSKSTFTKQSLDDLQCCIQGTLELVDRVLSRGGIVNLGFINSDVVENHFCQIRTLYNGANNNPSYCTYCYMQNSVVLTQPKTLPGKRNANTYVTPAKRPRL